MAVITDAEKVELIAKLFASPFKEGLLGLEWPEFEDFVQYVFECAGYNVEKVASYHYRHHVDLMLRHKAGGKVVALVEVRRYSTANIIKARVLQFLGALLAHDVPRGYIVTTSDFTQPAYMVAQQAHGKVGLINGDRLLRYIRYVHGTRLTDDEGGSPSMQQALISPQLLLDAEAIPRRDAQLTTVLAIANNKGGVAKTTTALNLAFALAEKAQQRILLVDLDGQSSLTQALTEGLTGSATADVGPQGPSLLNHFTHQTPLNKLVVSTRFDRIWLLPADERLFRLELAGDQRTKAELDFIRAIHDPSLRASDDHPFDWIIFDTPASQSVLTRLALAASHYVLLPATAEVQAALGANRALTTVRTMHALTRVGAIVIGGVVTRWRSSASAEQALVGLVDLLHVNGTELLSTRIPEDSQIERANERVFSGVLANLFHLGRRQGQAAQAYEQLMQEVLTHVQRA